MRLVMAFFALVTIVLPVRAQMRDNRDTELQCNDGRNRARTCEIRETTLGPSGSLDIQPGHNGGITVKGWGQNHILVRARLEAWAENDAEARAIASQIRVEATGGLIRATGPELNDNFFRWDEDRRWAVSLEVFVPWNTHLKLSSHNGGISVSDIRGRIDLDTHNGGVRIIRAAGDIRGRTHNGSIQAEFDGNLYEGREIELNTHNGTISLALPASFSARVEARRNRGRVESDFPISVTGRLDSRNMSFNIGSGGPLVRVGTHNGGIRFRKM